MKDVDYRNDIEFARFFDTRLVEISKHRNIPISELREDHSKDFPALQKIIQEGIDKRQATIWSRMCNFLNRV